MRRLGAQRITAFVVFDLCGTVGAAAGGHLNGFHGVQLLLFLAMPSLSLGITAAVLALTQARRSRRARHEDV